MSLRILLVEDDPNDVELVRACLGETSASGAEIVHAASLAAGLRALENGSIDLVVLDLDLPDSCGFDTLEKLAAVARVPLIVVTGNPHPALAAEAFKRRAYEVLKKSELDARSLMRIVRLASLQSRTEAAQARTRRIGLMYAALSAANEASARLKDERELYQRICELVVQLAGMKLACVRVLDPHTRRLEVCASAGEAAACLDPEAKALREDRTMVGNGLACVPLRRGELPVAVFSLYSADAGHFDAELVTLVERMAANIGHALERLDGEKRLQRLKTMYAALGSANEAILRAESSEEMLDRACRIAVESGDFLLGTVLMLDRPSGLLHRGAASGPMAKFAEQAPASIDAAQPAGQGLIGLACRSLRPAISNDYRADPRARKPVCQYAVGAAAAFPLVVEGELAGVFVLQHAEAGAFNLELSGLLQRLADNISFALENLLREERFRTVVNSANEGILVYDRALNVVAANAAAERILGLPLAQLLGKPGFSSLIPCVREDGSPLSAEDRPTRVTERTGQALTGHIIGIARPDGSITWLSVNTALLTRPEEPHHHGVVSTISDITGRRAAERALRESEARFRELTASSSDWYWELDEALRTTYVSEGYARLAGTTREEVLGTRLWDHGNLTAIGCTWKEHRERLERHETFRDFEYTRSGEDGTLSYLTISGRPVFDEAGAFRGYRGTGRDITAGKRTEEELRRFRAALNASADSIFLVDADAMEIIDLNDAAARSLGYAPGELLGANPAMLFEPRDEAQVRAAYERLTVSADDTQLFRAHLRHKDGSLVPVEGTRRLLRAAGRSYVVDIARDIAERLKAEERLQQSLERFEIVARATNDVVWDWNPVTDQLWWNENFRTVFGYEPFEVGAYIDSWTARIHPDDAERVTGSVRAAIARGDKSWSGEYRLRRKDGSYAAVFDRGLVIHDAAGQPVRMIGALMDITGRKKAERRMALHARRQEIIARLGQFALGGADLGQVLAEAQRALHAGGCELAAIIERGGRGAESLPDATWQRLADSEGAVVDERKVYVPIRAEQGPFGLLMIGSLREAAFDAEDLRFAEAMAHVLSAAVRRHHTQARLAYMAEFDALTGLPNRNLLQDRLAQSLAQAQRHARQGAVLFIDLDRFKLINDTLGHHVGDALIAEVGQRLKQCVRGGDTVGRVSGDEFAVVLAELAQPDDAALVAQKILEALAQPFSLGGNEAYVTASIGISVFPPDGANAETLLKNADMAMYRAKERTRNAYCFFTAEMNQRSVAKLQLNTDLRRAMERGEFVLHYQPKIDLRDGRMHGVEALLRWNHPSRGVVAPAQFIPALEESGLILPVGEWVLREAAAQLRAWQRDGLESVPVAVNLSAKQFRRRDLDALVRAAVSASGVSAGLIELEITESCLMDDPEDAVRLLVSLRAAGLKISVDDFGTGYSSLSYLTRLPLTALKIDRSFVREAGSSGEAASIVRAIIDMAHNLNFTVIAEGVETPAQLAFLRRHGCDLGQGDLFDAPLPAAQLAERLRRAA